VVGIGFSCLVFVSMLNQATSSYAVEPGNICD
jgi:hypothetical protein